ncbi:MAG: hypothetical protein WD757_09510 [Actinomycetota bacterium]
MRVSLGLALFVTPLAVPAFGSTAPAVGEGHFVVDLSEPQRFEGNGIARAPRSLLPVEELDDRRPIRRDNPSTITGRRTIEPSMPASVTGFDGIPNLAGVTPGDPTGAAGDSHVLSAVNVHFELFDLAGVSELGPSHLKSLFPGVPGGATDPKVVYDSYTDTFVLSFVAISGRKERSTLILVAIPDSTAADTATWCGSRLNGDQRRRDGRQFADYPALGLDEERVYLTSNQFDFGSKQAYRGAQILAFKKSNLYNCSEPLSFRKFTGKKTQLPDGRLTFTIQPAVTVGATPDAGYLLSFEWRCGNVTCSGREVTVWAVTEGGGSLNLSRKVMSVGRAALAPAGTQQGGSVGASNTWWDTGDLRLTTAFYDADLDRVYGAHAVFRDLDAAGDNYVESVVRWYEVAPGMPIGSSSAPRKGYIGTGRTDAGWPAVATDGDGNLFATYSRASAVPGFAEYLSSYAATVPPAVTAFDGLLLLEAGDARYEYGPGPERWGDYNAMTRDPADPSQMWAFNQIPERGGGVTSDFLQVIDEITFV